MIPLPQPGDEVSVSRCLFNGVVSDLVLRVGHKFLAWGNVQMSDDVIRALDDPRPEPPNHYLFTFRRIVDPLTFEFEKFRGHCGKHPSGSAVLRVVDPSHASCRITVRIDGDRLELVENVLIDLLEGVA